MAQDDLFKKLVAHCKEYGYVFPSSEIYDGLSAVYDYGQYGVELKNNIKKYWWDSMVLLHDNIVGSIRQYLCTPMYGKPQAMLMHSTTPLSIIRIQKRGTVPISD
jgi:hypothetical protein